MDKIVLFKRTFLLTMIGTLINGSVMAQNTFPATGNVGIGTTSPTNLLDVRGGNIYTNGSVFIDGGDLVLKRTSLAFGYVVRPNLTGFKKLQFAVEGGGPLEDLYVNANRSYFTGNVGIGTAGPSNLLQVHNVNVPANTIGSVSEITNFSGFSSTGNGASFKFLLNRHTVGNTDWINVGARLQFTTDVTKQGYVEFNPKGDPNGVAIGTAGTELIRFQQSGNVGIGTTSPGPYKLAVEGTLGARKVKVTQAIPWADYVFEKDYPLPSLAEVEKYIQQHKHLPDVPSAAEVEKNGLDIGDNQAVLLKKIEELTLYIIEQNKKIKELEEDNKVVKILQKEIEEIKKSIQR